MTTERSSLLKARVIVCVGSGGVGKTTVSSSLGVLAAQEGRKVLVMTIDPSLRLKQALGLAQGALTSQIQRVPHQSYKGQLDCCLLISDEIFNDFIRRAGEKTAEKKDQAEKLVQNRLYQLLSTTLSGSQEFTSLLQLTQMVQKHDYDLIILDTPPAQHAIDFLEAPQKLEALFQDSIVKWFLASEEGVGLLRRILSRGTLAVLGALEKITGSVFMNELSDFFSSVQSVQADILQKTKEVQELLTHTETQFLLVAGIDEAQLKEAEDLHNYLKANRYKLGGVIINRVPPLYSFSDDLNSLKLAPAGLINTAKELELYSQKRHMRLEKFIQSQALQVPVFKVQEMQEELVGLKNLERLSYALRENN